MVVGVIKFLDFIQKIIKATGVDYTQLRAIVAAKLMMDNRRHIVAFTKRKEKDSTKAFQYTFLIYLLFSLFVSLILLYYPSENLSLLVFFTYLMMMIAMTLITDFSSVLLDTSDNTIILPRPVDSRTLFLARLIHISVYLSVLAAGLSLFPLIAIAYRYSVLLLISFFVAVVMAILVAVLITNLLYLLIINFTSDEKLKNIINYLQIIITILIVGGYQLGPRLLVRLEYQTFEIDRWSLLIPSAWMTGMLEAIQHNQWDVLHIALTALNFIVPLGGGYIVYKYLTPVFTRKLSIMDNVDGAKTKLTKRKKETLVRKISAWLTTSTVERSAFELVWRILGRDRKIKLKIYPSLGYILILGIFFLLNSKMDMESFQQSSYFIAMIYIAFMLLQIAINEISFSDNYKASWTYFAAPIDRPGEILTGVLKSIMIRLFIPVYVIIAIVILSFWGSTKIDDLIFGLLNNYLMLLVLALIRSHRLPLSIAPNLRAQSGTLARSLIILLLMAVLISIHYLLSQWPILLWCCIPIQLLGIYILQRTYRTTPWSQIEV